MSNSPNILLVNPTIWDFAAFDLWSKPLGLLYLAGTLRSNGYQVQILDCLDVHLEEPNRASSKPARRHYGTGKYFRQRLAKPKGLEAVPRYYYRFGLPVDRLIRGLQEMVRPEAILVTTLMTYWYPGVRETIALLKKVFPESPVILGGTYATLMPGHAAHSSGTDYLITGEGEVTILNLMAEITGQAPVAVPDPGNLDSFPYPAFDLYPNLNYVCLLTSRGCPYACPYCASKTLQPIFRQRSAAGVAEEIHFWNKTRGILDFAFYDDALMVHFDRHLGPILEDLLKKGVTVRFHTPNALHLREVTLERARLLFRAGFKTLRFGLETTNWARQRAWGGKLVWEELRRSVAALWAAGFEKGQIEVYLLGGLPGQTLAEIQRSIQEAKDLGLRTRLAEYSPIPGTPLWQEACQSSRFPIEEEPLYHNNSLFPCLSPFSWETVQELKDLARA
jgi:radical SAM superfamily enzyme YgiQ (UPF0313 family)